MVKICNGLFGDIDITEEQILDFVEGLLGFPNHRRFAIFDLQDYQPFVGLQSLDDPEIGFVLVDPRFFVGEYKPAIPGTELQKLKLHCLEDAQVYSIVVLNSDVKKITTNLLAPILVNPYNRVAGQFVLNNEQDKYLLKYPLYQANTPKAG